MKKILIGICLILGIALVLYYKTHPLSASVTIKGKIYLVDIAITGKDKEKGLGYRKSMPENHGMLFIYDHKDQYQFGMKNMQFPLDFLWLNGNEIVEITKHVPITSPTIKPNMLIDKVVELNAGQVDQLGIVVGDTVLFNK